MAEVMLVLIDGFEEVEALTVVDILRRGGVNVTIVSLTGKDEALGKHHITVKADAIFENARLDRFDMLVIPGGTIAYVNHAAFMNFVAQFAAAQKLIAAICAAPAVLGRLGLLKGKTVVCYPGMEAEMIGATIKNTPVETDGLITTGRGPGLAIPFALEVLRIIAGEETKKRVADEFLVSA